MWFLIYFSGVIATFFFIYHVNKITKYKYQFWFACIFSMASWAAFILALFVELSERTFKSANVWYDRLNKWFRHEN